MTLSRNELTYGQPTMPAGVIGAVKLKNRLRALDPHLVMNIKNSRLNGITTGACGFVSDPGHGTHVYVSTEDNIGLGMLYRTAGHERDYRGGTNRFAHDLDELVESVITLLRSPDLHA